MNKQSLGALVALNIVLLVALVMVSVAPEPAYGQLRRAEYIMVSGNVTGRGHVLFAHKNINRFIRLHGVCMYSKCIMTMYMYIRVFYVHNVEDICELIIYQK